MLVKICSAQWLFQWKLYIYAKIKILRYLGQYIQMSYFAVCFTRPKEKSLKTVRLTCRYLTISKPRLCRPSVMDSAPYFESEGHRLVPRLECTLARAWNYTKGISDISRDHARNLTWVLLIYSTILLEYQQFYYTGTHNLTDLRPISKNYYRYIDTDTITGRHNLSGIYKFTKVIFRFALNCQKYFKA